MKINDYHFITYWQVPGKIEDVADILSDATDLPRWWPSVYLTVQEIMPGDENGIGKEISLYTKGWLPYKLCWNFRVIKSDYPHGFSLQAWGDFVGRGEWALRQDGDYVKVIYDWRVRADKPLLRRFSFLLRPLFEANHRWAMTRGEESLLLELARRSAPEPNKIRLPSPPGPTVLRDYIPFLFLLSAFVLVTAYLLYRLIAGRRVLAEIDRLRPNR
jgi:hypothetical protein